MTVTWELWNAEHRCNRELELKLNLPKFPGDEWAQGAGIPKNNGRFIALPSVSVPVVTWRNVILYSTPQGSFCKLSRIGSQTGTQQPVKCQRKTRIPVGASVLALRYGKHLLMNEEISVQANESDILNEFASLPRNINSAIFNENLCLERCIAMQRSLCEVESATSARVFNITLDCWGIVSSDAMSLPEIMNLRFHPHMTQIDAPQCQIEIEYSHRHGTHETYDRKLDVLITEIATELLDLCSSVMELIQSWGATFTTSPK